jgi:hypothetical protein
MCEANAARAGRSLVEAFSSLEDTRCPINLRHHLTDMIVVAIAAVLAGASGWSDVEQFGHANEKWFRETHPASG